ncbi:MAG: hypothetical protein KDC92_17595, partial [Bacteroidetes bacterium]|nr:hypothetical protein [Bacteroidota bacterium]
MLNLKISLGSSLVILAFCSNCYSQYFSLNPIADNYFDNNEFDSALIEFSNGLNTAILSNDTAAFLHNIKGQMHVWRTIGEEVDLNKLQNQIASWRKTDTSNYYFRAVSVYGMYLYDLGKKRDCIIYYDSLIRVEPEIQRDYFIYAGILSCIGDAYSDLELYDSSFYFYNKSVMLYEKIENSYEIKRVRKHIALLYGHNGQEEKGLNIKRGYLADTTLNAHDRAILYNNIAISHVNMGNPDSAIYYYNKTKELADVHKRTNLQNTVLNNLSHALEDKIALQEEKVKNRGLQRNILLLVLVIGLLVGAIAIYTLITRIKNMKILAAEKEKRHQQELANIIDQSEMQSLAAQMQAMK